MRVKITERKLKDEGFNLVEGDTITVDDTIGTKWCERGWAEDTDGNIATGERKPGVQELTVQSATLTGKGRVK